MKNTDNTNQNEYKRWTSQSHEGYDKYTCCGRQYFTHFDKFAEITVSSAPDVLFQMYCYLPENIQTLYLLYMVWVYMQYFTDQNHLLKKYLLVGIFKPTEHHSL